MQKDELTSVTVVVLTCGEFDRLETTLNSVIRQTCPVDAVVVSDDGSKEKFPSALQKQFPTVEFRSSWQNIGTVAHMNKAAQGIPSKYIKFMAVGDAFSDLNALAALVSFADDKGVPVVTSQSVVCDETLNRRFYPFPGKRARRLKDTGEKLFRALSLANLISAPGTLFHRSFFTKLGGFDESYHLLEDWPAWLRLARDGYAIPCLDRVTCLYMAGGISSQNLDAYHSPKLRRDMVLCYEKEILPYLERFSPRERHRIQYGYALVCGTEPKELQKRYWWLDQKSRWKRRVKGWLLRL